MTNLKELKNKSKEDCNSAKDLDQNKNAIDELELNEDQLENVSGGYPKPYSHGSIRKNKF